MIKAETLFRKFQRLVEAVDKKPNFPAPRKDGSSANASEGGQSGSNEQQQKGKNKADAEEPKVITTELRGLLSRHVEVLPRDTVAQKGDGMPAQ